MIFFYMKFQPAAPVLQSNNSNGTLSNNNRNSIISNSLKDDPYRNKNFFLTSIITLKSSHKWSRSFDRENFKLFGLDH